MLENGDFLAIYNIRDDNFENYEQFEELFNTKFDSKIVLSTILENFFVSKTDAITIERNFKKALELQTLDIITHRISLKLSDEEIRIFGMGFITVSPNEKIVITLRDLSEEYNLINHLTHINEYDDLTGLMNIRMFRHKILQVCWKEQPSRIVNKYALVYLDITKFKAINDLLGKAAGDMLLVYISEALKDFIFEDEFVCRIGSDRFAMFINAQKRELIAFVETIINTISSYELSMKVTCNIGIYLIDEPSIDPSIMLDRAIMAQSIIKGSVTQRYNFYTEEIRDKMLSEQEVIGEMEQALMSGQFVLYFQPQYNHMDGTIVGAEALVRWIHPDKGLISPGDFIPIFESNGFITVLDLYIFEEACKFIKKCIDQGMNLVPVSTNFSRYDIFQGDFVEKLELIRNKYNVPVQYLRVEITESSVVGGSDYTNYVVKSLHDCGYIVEMDDFGSGYSSLNVLKDIDFDIIKLDMKFLSGENKLNRGGTVITSIVNMAKWLRLPVIAEGVETLEQADFLLSIGTECIQGYLYSKPLPEEKYIELLKNNSVGESQEHEKLIDSLDNNNFWEPASQETLIFNNYVGGATVFLYDQKKIDILRVNKKYYEELGFKNVNSINNVVSMDNVIIPEDLPKFKDALNKAIETLDEVKCLTRRMVEGRLQYINATIRLIGRHKETYLFYSLIQNITKEYEKNNEALEKAQKLSIVANQLDLYYWDYDIFTKQMFPCERSQKDLGFPPVIHNFPDAAVGAGFFSVEDAEEIKKWDENFRKGAKVQEAVMYMSDKKIPFKIKCSTIYNSEGRPIKAFGTAIRI